MTSYHEFVAHKTGVVGDDGFAPLWMPEFLYPFQASLLDWAVRKGRSAILADCGLGKTPIQLAWAQNIVQKTNAPVLILTPLAVGAQTLAEARKFHIEAERAVGQPTKATIYVSNYQRLHHFDAHDFAGVVCDESSILKSFDGATHAAVCEFAKRLRYRLLCTATAAPNDYIELGTSSEVLGHLGFMDMLARFFKNNRNNAATGVFGHSGMPQWRFRGHAEVPFWQWVCSWARSVRKPSDLGFDDGPFELPALVEQEHIVKADKPREGMLFSMPAVGLAEERAERRRTITERCERVAMLLSTEQPAVAWAHLNDEADLLERLVPGAIQVSGRDSDDEKEEKFAAFSEGKVRVLVTKPIIGAWGLNWQHCAHMTTFSGHSFEQYYQSVRRFWRFGQTRTVVVDHVLSDGEERVLRNLRRKAEQADKMYAHLNASVNHELRVMAQRQATRQEMVPGWL